MIKKTTKQFIEESIQMHGTKYDYTHVIYTGAYDKVKIICPIHGPFFQVPISHSIKGKGCKLCGAARAGALQRLSFDEFKKRFAIVHGNKYDISLVDWNSIRATNDYVTVICPTHGEFKSTPQSLILGKTGCPRCKKSKGENLIADYLNQRGIIYQKEKRFNKCRDKALLRFDFFVPSLDLLIEYNGKQHYEPVVFYKEHTLERILLAQERFSSQLKRDQIKQQFAIDQGYTLLIIPYYEINPTQILESSIPQLG